MGLHPVVTMFDRQVRMFSFQMTGVDVFRREGKYLRYRPGVCRAVVMGTRAARMATGMR